MAAMTGILVLNIGSSSLKASLFRIHSLYCEIQFHFKNVQSSNPTLVLKKNGEEKKHQFDHAVNFEQLFGILYDELEDTELIAIGHRFVHGGELQSPYRVNHLSDLDRLKELTELAPLHNPYCIKGIELSIQSFPVSQWIFFDTSFHRTLPDYAKMYAIPYEFSLRHKIQRYGFHGIAHAFLWKTYVRETQKKSLRMITVHLGNGCSLAAIKDGISLDTSMGFSPLEGLVMATRCGDIDASIVEFLCRKEKKTPEEVLHILNFESGLRGISGISNMEELIRAQETKLQAKLALELFCYRIVKAIGSFIAVLEGVDVIVFSGGIGENSPFIREKIMKAFHWMGIKMDFNPAELTQLMTPLTKKNSLVEVYVTKMDENSFIAEEIIKKLPT
jgi:acetate kinase